MSLYWSVLCVLAALQAGLAYPTGPPPGKCINAYPRHGKHEASTSPPPFNIKASAPLYSPGGRIKFTLESDRDELFKGFLLRVQRNVGNTEQAVGIFLPDSLPPTVQSLTAGVQPIDCIGHNSDEVKSRVQVMWQAPRISVGDVIVRATVVTSYDEFWTNIELRLNATDMYNMNQPDLGILLQEMPVPAPATTGEYFDFESCGTTKGCAVYPAGCNDYDECRFAVSWKRDVSQPTHDVMFEAFADVDADYLALGFSHDMHMGNDDVITCVAADTYTSVKRPIQHGRTDGMTYNRAVMFSTTIQRMVRANGKLYCAFQRPLSVSLSTPAGEAVAYDFRLEKFHMLVAHGDVYAGSDEMMKHDQLPLISKKAIDFRVARNIYDLTAVPVHLKIHAVLGLVSWMAMAVFGALMARHYRSALRRDCCGSRVWFNLHWFSMVVATLIAAFSVTLMFVFTEHFSEGVTGVHAVCGLVTLGLGLIQVLWGVCRPDHSQQSRSFYNRVHAVLGLLALLLSAVTVVLGVVDDMIDRWLMRTEVIILAAWFGFYLLFEVMLEVINCVTENTIDYQKSKATRRCQLFGLALLVVVSLTFLVAAVYFIAIA